MSIRLKQVLIWGVLLCVTFFINKYWSPIQNFVLNLTPISIWKLELQHLQAFGITLFAAIVSWFFSIFAGYFLGLIAGASTLHQYKAQKNLSKFLLILTSKIHIFFQALFVTPLVLTLSLTMTILLKINDLGYINRAWLPMLMVLASGVALAGQRVFIAVYDSIVNASSDDKYLTNSISISQNKIIPKKLRKYTEFLKKGKALIACRISLLAQAIEQAFHLSLVGVIIAETITPNLYEYTFAQSGKILEWGGGIGMLILREQSTFNPEIVAASIWVILIFDFIIVSIIKVFIEKMWLTHYWRK